MGNLDKVLVAWVALALALMLPSPQWQGLAPTARVQAEGRGAASQPLQQDDEGSPRSTPYEELPTEQLQLQLYEDDVVMHDDCVLVSSWVSLKLTPVARLAPDALHTRQPERPPLRSA